MKKRIIRHGLYKSRRQVPEESHGKCFFPWLKQGRSHEEHTGKGDFVIPGTGGPYSPLHTNRRKEYPIGTEQHEKTSL